MKNQANVMTDMPFWGCYRKFGRDTRAKVEAKCSTENTENSEFTVSLPSITDNGKAAAMNSLTSEGFWTADVGWGSSAKYVDEAYDSHACSNLVAGDYGSMATGTEMPVGAYCQKLGCGEKECLNVNYKCNDLGLQEEVTFTCGAPENIADFNMPFFIFMLVCLIVAVILCILPLCSKSSNKVVPS